MTMRALPLALLATLACATPAAADNDHHRHWSGDIHRFHDRDMTLWIGGHWTQGRHDRRRGWWWVVDDVWYPYPQPVYPYPNPYQPPTVVFVERPAPNPQPPAVVTPEPEPDRARDYSWYYCGDPAGYYPYVQDCGAAWKKVSTTPKGISMPTDETPPPPPPPPAEPAMSSYWYHCTKPDGYYPYVAECTGKWEKVPAREGD